jgi:hypothetical protein
MAPVDALEEVEIEVDALDGGLVENVTVALHAGLPPCRAPGSGRSPTPVVDR